MLCAAVEWKLYKPPPTSVPHHPIPSSILYIQQQTSAYKRVRVVLKHTEHRSEAKTRKMWNFHEFSFSFAQINIFSSLSAGVKLSVFFFCCCFSFFNIILNILALFSSPLSLWFYILQHDIRPNKAKMIQFRTKKLSSFKLSCMLCRFFLLLFRVSIWAGRQISWKFMAENTKFLFLLGTSDWVDIFSFFYFIEESWIR